MKERVTDLYFITGESQQHTGMTCLEKIHTLYNNVSGS